MKQLFGKRALFGILILLAVLCICVAASAADSGTCGADLTWELDDQGTLTISGSGTMEDYDYWGIDAPWGKGVQSVVIKNGVTSIGNYAFYYCSNLESVRIADGVISIGGNAFRYCSSLSSIKLPNSVTSIGDNAFFGGPGIMYTGLNSETAKALSKTGYSFRVPDTKYDLRYVFDDDNNETGLAVVSADADCTAVSLPKGITSIGDSAFKNCSSLTSVTIPDSVTSIGRSAFYGCSSLTSVTIPDSVTSIGEYAFRDCSSLMSVTIPDGVSSIGNRAFYNCAAIRYAALNSETAKVLGKAGYSFRLPDTKYDLRYLYDDDNKETGLAVVSVDADSTEISLPSGVTSIGNNAFKDCSSLTSVKIPDNLTSIGYSAFSGCPAVRYTAMGSKAAKVLSKAEYSFRVPDTKYDLRYLYDNDNKETGLAVVSADADCTAVSLPNEVTRIGYGAFSRCSSLMSITIPADVTGIDEYAFSDCSSLTSVMIPDSVISIANYVFSGCSSLTSVTIPSNLTRIGYGAFDDCPAVRYASLDSDAAKTLSREGYSFRVSGNKYDLEYTFDMNNEISGLTLLSVDPDVTTFTVLPEVTGFNTSRWNNETIFSQCLNLTSITMNTAISEVDFAYFFDNCVKLEGINFPSDHPTYCSKDGVVLSKDESRLIYCPKGKPGEYTIPGTISNIPNNVFTNCTALTGIHVPISVTSIENSVFEGCSGLVSAMIEARTENIYFSSIFSGCTNLTSVTIADDHHTYSSRDGVVFSKDEKTLVYCPKGKAGIYSIPKEVSTISSYAFSECTVLTGLEIPQGVRSIGESAFYGCVALSSVKIPEGIQTINNAVFCGCTGLTAVIIPEGVRSINSSAFFGCSGLTDIAIPAGVESISDYAFSGCAGLKTIHFPDTLYWIGCSAFGNCTSLGKVILPPNIGHIDDYAFNGCTSMKTATLYESVTFIGTDAFEKTTIIKAPKDSYAAKWAYEHYYDLQYVDSVCTVTMSNDGNGTASADPSFGPKGTEVALTATPNKGYQFKEWVVIAGGVEIKNNRFTIGSANVEIRAVFEPITVRTSIAKAKVTVKDQVYTGKAIKPKVTVKIKKKTLAAGTDYTLTFKNNKAIGTATVTVTGKGAYTGKIQATFKINPKAVALSSLEAGSQKLTVKWKKSSGITGYEIQYGLKKNFKDAKTVTIKKAKTTSMKIGKLKKGKTYYVRIRVYKTVKGTKYYSAWSKALKQKVK